MTRTQLLVLRGPAWLASRSGLALIAAALLAVVVALYAFGRWHAGFGARRALDAQAALQATWWRAAPRPRPRWPSASCG